MRIALIADTHGHIDPRLAERVRGADILIHAGDVGNGVERLLRDLAPRVVIVQGNNDPADSGWPESERLALPGGELAVSHGHRWPAKKSPPSIARGVSRGQGRLSVGTVIAA